MRNGYSVIEVLVVVAIIGILSSIVLASVNSARCKENPRMCMHSESGVQGDY